MVITEGKTKALLALWGSVLLWSSSFIALKFAFRHFDPMVVIFGRMLVASVCFLTVFRSLRKIDYQPGDWKLLAFMGICEPGFYFVFEAMALTYTDASQAGMICALLPLMVAVAARFTLGEPLTKRTVSGFGLAIVGAVTLSAVAESTETASNPMLGNFLEFMAMICACGYMITLKKLTLRYNPWFLTMVQAFVGTIFYFPLLFLPTTTLPTEYDPSGLATIVYLGLFVTILAYGLYNYGMSKTPAAQASAFINLIPVITLILGMILLGERLNWMQYVASALVVVGVYVSQDKSARQEA
ncbi:MAG: DMT family transporter [Desulfovibrionaceae bacterium]|nr:DMT family transporter [Desulfovibrionaceae bacterium]